METIERPPAFEAPGVLLYEGDCIEVMRDMPAESVHAIVTDPPYGLGFMGREWDALPPGEEFAREALRVLKPGGHIVAFGGSRTWHRLAVAIEDAGFEIRDSIAWLYASGFPKSMDVSAAIDKIDATAERVGRAREFQAWLSEHLSPQRVNELTRTNMGHHLTTHPTQPAVATAEVFDMLRPALPTVPARIEELVAQRTVESKNFAAREVIGQHANGISRGAAGVTAAGEGKARTAALTAEARAWEGWGTALKPAFEPIVVGRKPLAGTVAANVLAHGTGALNIDACRIEAGSDYTSHSITNPAGIGGVYDPNDDGRGEKFTPGEGGRWPSNVVLDDALAADLDEQSGVRKSGMMRAGTQKQGKTAGILGEFKPQPTVNDTYGDEGGASRFFPVFRFEAKAPTSERPVVDGVAHPTVKPLALMRWLCRLVTPKGGTILEPFAGSGTTLEAAAIERFDVIGIEKTPEYIPLIKSRFAKPVEITLGF